MRKFAGKKPFTVGEYRGRTANELRIYLGKEHVTLLFDMPLRYNLYTASCSNVNVGLIKIFSGTFAERDPVHAMAFAESHGAQPSKAQQPFVQAWFKLSIYTQIFLRKADYLCIYSDNLYGIPNGDNIPTARKLSPLMEIRRRFAYVVRHDLLDAPGVTG